MALDAYCFTNQGGRDHNEDAAGIRIDGSSGIFVVADGLGGHKDGQLAAKAVVDTFITGWEDGVPSDRKAWLEMIMEQANDTVIALQEESGGRMKSTSAVLAIDGKNAAWGNVGDSRVYYLRGGAIQSVTADHSVAYKKFLAGEITRNDLPFDDDQSSLLRAMGNAERHKADLYESIVPLGYTDGFMLCSDGAWEYLKDDEILVDFLKAEDAKRWGELLLLRIMDRLQGGNDNLSIITVLCDR